MKQYMKYECGIKLQFQCNIFRKTLKLSRQFKFYLLLKYYLIPHLLYKNTNQMLLYFYLFYLVLYICIFAFVK